MTDLHEVASEYAAVPVVAPTPASVIVARGRQLRARRRRRRIISAVVLIATVPTVALATVRAQRESSVKVIAPSPITVLPAPSRSPTTTANRDGGYPAVWFIRPGPDVTSASESFTALVTRLACNSGVTGAVLPPTVKSSDARVVVTFTVKAGQPGAQTCIGNRPVPVVVNLGEAIGQRQLVDGACHSGGEAATTSFCIHGSVRWNPGGA